jgi:hypothetical protein
MQPRRKSPARSCTKCGSAPPPRWHSAAAAPTTGPPTPPLYSSCCSARCAGGGGITRPPGSCCRTPTALTWIEQYGDADGDGFVEYSRKTPQGLANQGWKDSWDGINFASGQIAEPPIALAEVQGYVYAAYRARAAMSAAGARAVGHRLRRRRLVPR